MKFLLLLSSPQARWDDLPETGTDAEMDQHAALIEDLHARGLLLDCSPLAPAQQALAVRVRDGATATTGVTDDGRGESLAGYYLIECATVEQAVDVAARIPEATRSAVMVHPLLDLPGVPTGPRPPATVEP